MGAGRGQARRARSLRLRKFPTDPFGLESGDEICAIILQLTDDGNLCILGAGKTTVKVQSSGSNRFYTPAWNLGLSFEEDQATLSGFKDGDDTICHLYEDVASCRAEFNAYIRVQKAQIPNEFKPFVTIKEDHDEGEFVTRRVAEIADPQKISF